MKTQTLSAKIVVNASLAFLVLLGLTSILFAGAPVFEAPPGSQMPVWRHVGIAGFSAGVVDRPTLALDSNDVPYVAYRDSGNARKATVMKFDGTSWEIVGSAGFSADQARYVSIAVDNLNIPYVAYEDYGNSGKATVMKFEGSGWVPVGSAGFSPDNASEVSLVIDRSHKPYVLYEYSDPVSDENNLAVMRYDGGNWDYVGAADFTEGEAYDSSLALDGNGTPYVAFLDVANADKATVMKFDGNSWVTVGSAGFSENFVGEYTDIAIDGNGTPYLVYEDGDDRKATVMKFDGSSWVIVGTPGFSAGEAHVPSIAIDSEGNPFVAYGDYAASEKLTVMMYDGISWVTVDAVGITEGYIFTPSLAIDGNDCALVVYEDWGNDGKASVLKTIDGFKYEVAENTTAIGTVVARDPESDPITYTMSGADSGFFHLDGLTGELRFVLAPDAEAPADADRDNLYEFTLTASANGDEASTKASITVVNVAEDPMFLAQPTWYPVGSPGFSGSISSSPFLAVDSSDTPYLIYRSTYQGQVVVQLYDGTTWQLLGPEFNAQTGYGISAGSAYETSLAFDSTDTPSIVYRDEVDSNKLVVKQSDGESWVALGSGGFTAASPNYAFIYPAIALDSTDTPYVVYSDAANAKRATVMRFAGSSWVTVGSAGFSAGESMYNDITVDNSDTPYVVYGDVGNSRKATVMKFDGSAWVNVGSPGLSADWIQSASIAVDSQDVAYVAYDDRLGTSYRSTVMRFNGHDWVPVGPRRFPSTDTANTFLALDGQDIPYVAFAQKYPGGVTVMKFNGTAWDLVGEATISDGSAVNTTMAFGGSDTPHVGFWDYANNSKATVLKTVGGALRLETLENVAAIGRISAFDPEDDPIAYSISGGDSGLFGVDNTSGELTFITTPDFENPQDIDRNNVYVFNATIRGGGVELSTEVYVLVHDDAENPAVVAPVITANQLSFTLTGVADTVVVIEASPDLAEWVEVGRATLTEGSGTFSDPVPVVMSSRFYRVRTL
jgi:hypothetical protein